MYQCSLDTMSFLRKIIQIDVLDYLIKTKAKLIECLKEFDQYFDI